jgi:hypothetical protein
MNVNMKIETGWVNDDFVKCLHTIKVTMPHLIVVFKASDRYENVSADLHGRVIIYKMTNRLKTIISSGATGVVNWGEVL